VRSCTATGPDDFLGCPTRAFLINIYNLHGGAFNGKLQRNSAADAAGRPRDDCRFACEP
jgi:hypothetical protein